MFIIVFSKNLLRKDGNKSNTKKDVPNYLNFKQQYFLNREW